MYKRFLNNLDYLSIVTEEALGQLVRNREARFAQAEEAAEASVLEYLNEKYMAEETLAIGKNLLPYNRQVTYPAGAHFYYNDKIYKATRTINGYKEPAAVEYWEVHTGYIQDEDKIPAYTQRGSYSPGDIVKFAGTFFKCLEYNGADYKSVRIPGINAWERIEVTPWEANYEYNVWEVVSFESKFYALLTIEDIDWTLNPNESDNWGLIGTYDPDLNKYELSPTEYVEYEGQVYYPVINPNSDELKEKHNIIEDDPRNANLKKHILRLAIYELYKLISPNNVSQSRITDYETSIEWLRDASRMRINPQIPRRIGDDKKPIVNFAVATFMRDYDPNNNPWQI